MKFILKVLIIMIISVFAIFFLRFIIGSSEDDWICVNGEWIKHGVPKAPMPIQKCD